MQPNLNNHDPQRTLTSSPRNKVGKRHRLRNWSLGTLVTLLCLLGIVVFVGFVTPWGIKNRLLLAESIITTRHYYLAHYITTPSEYAKLEAQLHPSVYQTNVNNIHVVTDLSHGPVTIQPIAQNGWNGYVMFVHDPRLIRLVQAKVSGSEGEYITNMAPRVGAIAGTNASGFEDPSGNGWGGIPVGLEYVGGTTITAARPDPSWTTVGFTSGGVMVMGHYSLSQLQGLGVRDAMQFHPELVVNGKPMITYGDGGWGLGPRTAIGQEANGTVIFIVINGRLKNGSLGASMRQVQDLMLKYGAVNACAMDGGSSSLLYDSYSKHPILNSPSTIDPNGERHLPDAWLVFPTESAASNYHV